MATEKRGSPRLEYSRLFCHCKIGLARCIQARAKVGEMVKEEAGGEKAKGEGLVVDKKEADEDGSKQAAMIRVVRCFALSSLLIS